jgi:titin
VIAFNSEDGVLVGGPAGSTNTELAGRGNAVLGNSIFGNGGLGIDLGPDDGVTPNGTSGYQPFPVLTSVTAGGGAVIVAGTLASTTPFAAYRIELFANAAADPSGHGEGQVFLGVISVTAGESGGVVPFAAVLAVPLARGQVVSATATDGVGNTSEFSADVVVQ